MVDLNYRYELTDFRVEGDTVTWTIELTSDGIPDEGYAGEAVVQGGKIVFLMEQDMLSLTMSSDTEASSASDYSEGWDGGVLAGWVGNTAKTNVEVRNTGGNPDGYLRTFGDVGGSWDIGAIAGPTLSEVNGYYGAAGIRRVSFDLLFISGNFDDAWFRVRFQDASHNGWRFPVTNTFPLDEWISYTIEFDPTWSGAEAIAAGWIRESPPVGFRQTMSNVYHPEVRISGEGFLEAGIDNFRLTSV